MLDILKLALTLALIVVLLRRKVQVGYVLLLGAALLVILYLMPPGAIFASLKRALTSEGTIKLAVALTAIRGFEMVLREKEIMKRMMEAAHGLLKRRKAVIVSMPLLIGMLPSVGGAYFSAPMVDEATKGLGMGREEKAFINYWYRHPWEYILPLYPGIVLASVISGHHLQKLILANLPYALAIGLTGLIFSMRGVGRLDAKREKVPARKLGSFFPIAFVLLLVVAFGMELHWSLLTAFFGLVLFYRYPPREIWRLVRHAVSPDVLVLIAGVMVFKEVMEGSGAVANLSAWLREIGMPLLPLLFILPFAGGLLTGLTLGFVGSTFPLIMSLDGGNTLAAISFAFASGFLGVLASPVHVCFILTREYFGADLGESYRRMLPAGAVVLGVALAEYFLLR